MDLSTTNSPKDSLTQKTLSEEDPEKEPALQNPPQLPFKEPQLLSKRDHEVLSRGTLGAVGCYCPFGFVLALLGAYPPAPVWPRLLWG